MPLLFSYGTLQEEAVQLFTFGRRLEGERDALSGFEPARVPITDAVSRASGKTHHANAAFTGRSDSRVEGTAFEVTDEELKAADQYERPASYVRRAVTLVSGKRAWVYVHDRGTSVRPVEPTDLDRWIEMRVALWPNASREEHTTSAKNFFEQPAATLEAVLVAVDGEGQLVGFAELSRRPYAEGCETSPVGFLEGWYVEPGWRGRGVGRGLVAAAEEWARALGCREFASDTTLDNTASAAAHQALGFEEVEQIRCFRKSLSARTA